MESIKKKTTDQHKEWKHTQIKVVGVFFSKLHRKHDVTDAICLMLFWLNNQNKTFTREENIRRISEVKMKKSNMTSLEYLEQFRYIQY